MRRFWEWLRRNWELIVFSIIVPIIVSAATTILSMPLLEALFRALQA